MMLNCPLFHSNNYKQLAFYIQHPNRSQKSVQRKIYHKLCQQNWSKKRIMNRQLNLSTKMKRKQQKRFIELDENQQLSYCKDENIAAQNLFNISHFEDVLKQNKQLNPEADIFNSVSFQRCPPTPYQKLRNTLNSTKMNLFKSNPSQVSHLQKFLDNKFIQESKQLLKLYETHDIQNTSPPVNKINFKQYQTKKDDILSNSFKSESVFVIKRIPLNKQKAKEKKTTIKSEQCSPPKDHKQSFMTVSKQKGNNILRISPLLQTLKKQEIWLSKSFEISNEKSDKKWSFASYDKIQNCKTFNSFKTLGQRPQDNRRVKTIIDHHEKKSIKTVMNKYNSSSMQQRNTSSFRKRLTFYRNQRNKEEKSRDYLVSR